MSTNGVALTCLSHTGKSRGLGYPTNDLPVAHVHAAAEHLYSSTSTASTHAEHTYSSTSTASPHSMLVRTCTTICVLSCSPICVLSCSPVSCSTICVLRCSPHSMLVRRISQGGIGAPMFVGVSKRASSSACIQKAHLLHGGC